MVDVISQHIEVWTSVQMSKSTAGRGNKGKQTAYGIKKLRELILELAVRGKLVSQDPNDEPASVLLEKIAEEKARLVKEGTIKKQTPLPEISEDEKTFDLPNGWEWARIGNVGHDWGQKTPKTDFTYIDVSAIDNIIGIVKSPDIVSATEAPSRARKIVKVGTVIYSTVRPYLKNICVIDHEYNPEPIASTAFAILHPFQEMPGKFFSLYFRSPEFVKYVESVQTGIAYPAINDKQFFGGIVPIPPLAEQHRIVAKVDELMTLCDQLEQQQTSSNTAHQTLVEMLLATLTQSANQTEFAAAWQRIAAHFDTLFTTEHSIDQLKQTILQLAVMGKLVPQDPNDEPASVLLEKIAEEKARLVKEGMINKSKLFQSASANELPFLVPDSWAWTQAENICEVIVDCPHSTPIFENSGVICLDTNVFKAGKLISHKIRYVSEETYQKRISRLMPKAGDVVFAREGSVGASVIIPEGMKCCLGQRVMLFRPMKNVLSSYFNLSISEPSSLSRLLSLHKGIGAKHVNVADMRNTLIPLPPLAEQHRIVAKVDELMTFCDTLKTRIQSAQTTQIHLADAIVEQAVA